MAESNRNRVIGPSLPPWLSNRSVETEEMNGPDYSEKHSPIEPFDSETKPNSKRVIGPEIPSAEVLKAASLSTNYSQQNYGGDDHEEEEEDDIFPFIGPIPPEAIEEANNASESERFKQVERILTVDLNAYEILEVNQTSTSSEIKKKFMKLSLLVHPDKCSHSKSKMAFSTLNDAFKTLQKEEKRAAVDKAIEQKIAKEEYEKELKQLKEAAEWRRLRGESIPGDDEILNKNKMNEHERDSWMKELPLERQARAVQSNTYFSRNEKIDRGDTSIWTDTPMDREKKNQQKYLQSNANLMLESSLFEKEEILRRKNEENSVLIDAYNEKKRKKSLFEIHQQNMYDKRKKKKKGEAEMGGEDKNEKKKERKEKKKEERRKDKEKRHGLSKKKRFKEEESEESEASEEEDEKERRMKKKMKKKDCDDSKDEGDNDGDWKGKHPWKPWNREEDIIVKPKSFQLNKKNLASGLASRFGSSNERKFL